MPAAARPAFDIKSTAWTLTALRLQLADAAGLRVALDERFAESPGLFEQEPLVIDLSPLREADAVLDWPTLLAHLRHHGMVPVGAQGGSVPQADTVGPARLAVAFAIGFGAGFGTWIKGEFGLNVHQLMMLQVRSILKQASGTIVKI